MYFSSAVSHGYTSDTLLFGTICPIPKSNVLNVSEKYRAITLCSSITKLFDLIFIEKQKTFLYSDPLQFGFKREKSTTICTQLLTGIANKFVNEGSTCYTMLLDMSKAFDKVNHAKLFRIMLDRKMDPLYTRCLLYMYSNQKLRVKWDNVHSPYFNVTMGVKQGGVLSPLLFSIYIDGLISDLRKCTFGCYMGPNYAGALCYADDIAVMSPSRTGLSRMLNICADFAAKNNLSFNAAKS